MLGSFPGLSRGDLGPFNARYGRGQVHRRSKERPARPRAHGRAPACASGSCAASVRGYVMFTHVNEIKNPQSARVFYTLPFKPADRSRCARQEADFENIFELGGELMSRFKYCICVQRDVSSAVNRAGAEPQTCSILHMHV